MILIITENAAVGRDIAAIAGADEKQVGYREGNGYIVSWCSGRLTTADAEAYDPRLKAWSLETLPILPEPIRYVVPERGLRQFERLNALMHRDDVDSIICAADAGREGELNFRLLYDAAACEKPWKRLWTSSLEPASVRKALANLQDGHRYDALAAAARCRQEADWLLGVNLTRLYTCLYQTKLPTGRVQSPTLSLLVRRQQKIDRFQPQPRHVVTLRLADRFDVQHTFDSAPDADAFVAVAPETATVTAVKNEELRIAPPRLYDLTAMQCEANRLFGASAGETLADLQVLYGEHLITYPQTDSRYITSEMAADVQDMIQAFRSSGLLPQAETAPELRRIADSGKVCGHPALLPTAALTKKPLEDLPTGQKRLITLLLYRLLEATAEDYCYYTTTVEAETSGVRFTAQASADWDLGWKRWRNAMADALELRKVQQRTAPAADPLSLTGIEEGAVLPVTGIRQETLQTQPPEPYTEASLLTAMEGKGLGTSATRAAIIESLVANRYAVRQGRFLIPTEKGKTFHDVLVDRLRDPERTAEWERKLSDIELGKGDPEQFLLEIRTFLSRYISDVKRLYRPEVYDSVFTGSARSGRQVIGKCPLCGGDVLDYPKNYGCSNYKVSGCRFAIWKQISGVQLPANLARSLLRRGRTEQIAGFRRKDGSAFTAALELRRDGSVGFIRNGGRP